MLEQGKLSYSKKQGENSLKVLDLSNFVLDNDLDHSLKTEQKVIRLKHISDSKLDYILYPESENDMISWKQVFNIIYKCVWLVGGI